MVGAIIGNYKIVSILGEGGMGTVYKAFDMALERYVAIKVLSAQASSNLQFIERFKREAKNQAKLTHPNIVPVFGFYDESGIRAIVMEYVEGETLEKLISRRGKLDYKEALHILKQILAGVGYAHGKGFIHRDIKPSNIIINNDGIVKIMDFGISKAIFEKGITKTGTKIGTILYMSPEQIRAEEPTKQSDVYSIGITFYEMLVGKTPFDFGTEYEIMEGHLKKNPSRVSSTNVNVPPEIDKIVSRAIEKTIYKRYRGCDEFIEDVNLILGKYEKIETKLKESHKKKEEKNNSVNKMKARFGIFIAAIIGLTIFYFSFKVVRKFWTEYKAKNLQQTDTTATYNSSPNFVATSEWQKLNSDITVNLNSVFFIDNYTGFACGENAFILRTVDNGETWRKLIISDSCVLNDISFSSSSLGICVGEQGKIFRTIDLGESWQPIYSGVSENLLRIYFLNNSTGFILGGKGLILKTKDGGLNWNRVNSNTGSLLYSINFINEQKGFAVGWGGTVLTTNNAGETWNKISPFTSNYLKDVRFINQYTGFICGAGGEIFKTKDGGDNWEKVESNLFSGLTSIGFVDQSIGYIISNKGDVLVTTDGGDSWKKEQSGYFYAMTRIYVTPMRDIFIVGLNGIILRLKKG